MAYDHEDAKKRLGEARDYWSEQFQQMREDIRFSNPSNPEQWDNLALAQRRQDMRPAETFDFTNRTVMQIVNEYRQNKGGVQVLPVGGESDQKAALVLEGMVRDIEYQSRSYIADETAMDWAARTGLGFTRVITEVADPKTNEQVIRIKRIHDPMSVLFDPDSTEPDGSDATWCGIEANISHARFRALYPDADMPRGQSDDGWYGRNDLKICEYLEVEERETNNIAADGPDGSVMTFTEDEYWKLAEQVGFKPTIRGTFKTKERYVRWYKMSGEETLEETEFPSQYIPVFPVFGYESWVDEKRYLCGVTRRMAPSQRAYNVARNAEIELAMMSPKSPFIASAEAIDGHEDEWASLNLGNKPYLPYNARDEQGQQLPAPARQHPAQVSSAFIQLAQAAMTDAQLSVGMHEANYGQTGNETSGRAINARQRQGSIANYHYTDNMNRMVEYRARVIMDMIPRVYDTRRAMVILRESGDVQNVILDPDASSAYQKQGDAVIINPAIGSYGVRVQAGPGYTTMRQEAAEMLGQIMQNPALAPVVAPLWAKMNDWPMADKIAKALLAIAPPPVQAALADEEDQPIPPVAQQMIEGLQQQLQQQGEMAEQLGNAMETRVIKLERQLLESEQQTTRLQMQLQEQQRKNRKDELSILIDGEKIRIDEEKIRLEERNQIREYELRIAELQGKSADNADNNETKEAIAQLQARIDLILAGMQQASVVSETVVVEESGGM